MINQKNLEQFNRIYDESYDNTLKFIVCKCSNMEDVNDIIQEETTYKGRYEKYCEGLEEVNVTKNVTAMETKAFKGCKRACNRINGASKKQWRFTLI